jgi:hypothetical protein
MECVQEYLKKDCSTCEAEQYLSNCSCELSMKLYGRASVHEIKVK